MKAWVHLSDHDLALADTRSELLGRLELQLAPAGWVSEPLKWRPRYDDGVDVEIDIPDSPVGLLA